MDTINLQRMSGLGNDFLIYDARGQDELPNKVRNHIVELSSRKNTHTKGCDQFIIIKNASDADVFIEIYNADGSEVSACGNATRCVGYIIAEELQKKIVTIRTNADLLTAENLGGNKISVDMGKPIFDWKIIPLSQKVDVDGLPIDIDTFPKPSAVSMGNPHMVFISKDVDIDGLDVPKIGAPLEVHPLYPQKTNVEFASVIDKNNIRLRVFERGVGETLACGTGACATAVVAYRKGLTNSKVNIHMNGGVLEILYPSPSGHVIMTGDIKLEEKVKVEV